MEHTKLPLEHENGFPEYEKVPQEYENAPAEVENPPVEHHIPPEYYVSQPEPAKKKQGFNRMLMFAFAGFMTLYLGFGYLFPAAVPGLGDNHEQEEEGGSSWNPGELENPGALPNPQDSEMFLNYQEDFTDALTSYQEDDYVGAATTIVRSLMEKYESFDPARMDGTVMAFQDGAFEAFDGQKLTDDQGVYLWIEEDVFYYEDSKDGSMYAENQFIVSLVRVGKTTGKNSQLSILRISVPVNNLLFGYMYCEASHLSAVMDQDFNAENAVLTVFSLGSDDYGANEATVRDNCVIYGIRRVEGQIQKGTFVGPVKLQSSGMELNADKTQMQINENQADYGWIYMLGENGVIDPKSDRYADLSSYIHGEQAFTDKANEVKADPEYYGYYYLQGGEFPHLYLKNLSSDDYAYEHYVYEWDQQAFPLSDILYAWAAMKPHI